MKTITTIRRIVLIAVLAATGVSLNPRAAAREVDTDLLGEGCMMSYRVWLTAGSVVRYAVRGDDDAIDIDLDVVAPHGRVIVADYDDDAIPEVCFRVPCSGYYMVRVQMEDTWNGIPSYFTLHRL